VYAIAHVRGGQEMGRRWYDQGKMLNKRNTFCDFEDVAARSSGSATRAPTGSWPTAAAPAGCSWAWWPTSAPTCSAPWWPTCRSST
jgi:hypothetical protein